jgi:voltage-gated potassium channel
VADEAKLDRRLDRLIARADSPRRAAVVIASVTTAITVVAGVLISIVDSGEFPTVGSGLWWAVQTVTTVGYGDHVPNNSAGRIVATAVMLLGIGFVTVFTASITSAFVARQRKENPAAAQSALPAESVADLLERLERIEAALNQRS